MPAQQPEDHFNSSNDGEINSFLFSDCEFLACEINKKYGYQIEAVMTCHLDENEHISLEDLLKLDYHEYLPYTDVFYENGIDVDINIIHCYCTFEENGTKYYLDARGITSDREAFLDPYKEHLKDAVVMTFSDETDLRTRFFSTYYDWYGEEDFHKTEELRIAPAKKFMKNNPHLFERKTTNQNMSLEDKIKAATTHNNDKNRHSGGQPLTQGRRCDFDNRR